METFGRPCNRNVGTGAFFAPGPHFLAYDFLIEKYENKNPSKTLINIASRLILIAKKTHIAKYEQLRDLQMRIGPEPSRMGSLREIFAVLATFPREIIGR